MSNEQNGSAVYATSGKILLLGGGACILKKGISCIATTIFESPTDMLGTEQNFES